jgi:low affinity Fe/Cu permease
MIIISCAVIAIAGLVKLLCLNLTDTTIVLTFVGILATFVVVSNYVQINGIDKKVDEKIKEINEKEKYIDSKFDRLNVELYRHIIVSNYDLGFPNISVINFINFL